MLTCLFYPLSKPVSPIEINKSFKRTREKVFLSKYSFWLIGMQRYVFFRIIKKAAQKMNGF